MKKISIGSWGLVFGMEKPMPWEDFIKWASKLGFDGVELGGFEPHPNPDNLPEKSQREAWKQRLAEAGLGCSGFAPNLSGAKNSLIVTNDDSAYLDAFRKNLQFCVDCGIPAIRVDTLHPPTILDKVNVVIALQHLVNTWKVCAGEAAEKGVRLTWEFEPGFAFNKPSDIVRIVKLVDHDNFGVLFDTCHGYMVADVGARQPGKKETLKGGVVELAQKLRGKINHIHLIDSNGELHGGETSVHLPFGFEGGRIKFDELMPELAKNDMGHDWWTIDLCFRPDAKDVAGDCKRVVDMFNKKYG